MAAKSHSGLSDSQAQVVENEKTEVSVKDIEARLTLTWEQIPREALEGEDHRFFKSILFGVSEVKIN